MKFERIEQEGANSLDKIEFVMVACAAQALINGVMGPNLKDLRAAEGAGVSALGPLPATLGAQPPDKCGKRHNGRDAGSE
jgi:hypothetical protein